MTSQASSRLNAIASHLSPPSSTSDSSQEPLPPIPSKAASSTSPRVLDKVIIITGANSPLGIGRASAHQFAANGAKAIYICDYDDTYLPALKSELEKSYGGVDVHVRQMDVADEEAVKEVVKHAVDTYGRLDVFFANAGVRGTHAAYTDIEGQEFMDTMRTNVLSVFLAVKHAAPAMQLTSSSKPTASGSIIATASVAGIRSNAGSTDYSASKAAVISIAQTTAYQLMRTNVRVNALCPGLIETGMTELVFKMARERGTEKKVGQLNPLGRGGVADEIARVALFLGSDESSYVNGQAWAVCGGLSAGHPFVPGRIA